MVAITLLAEGVTLNFFVVGDLRVFLLLSRFFACEDKMLKPNFVPGKDMIDEVLTVRLVTLKKCESAHDPCGFVLIG
ncbi:hypothetical protein TNCT_487181 [Trichonephila clavata]|uniref:Uncharacterized protein n=1 Tax=Trichonephila clavata TaxID=2740835 RepID=A0A8X6LG84_TRICU|nr:hypothetical protein TNCT_487181 [Trichonephila clavata]